ncbi:High affinity cGMP-specific 3',5'-cyclic phosphodiesterase 9A, partial [Pseudolycoriella hygida]
MTSNGKQDSFNALRCGNVYTLNSNVLSEVKLSTCDLSDKDPEFLISTIKELQRKIDYTEKMNWLCLSNRPIGPPHRKTSLPNHTEVKKRFMEICDQTLSDEVLTALRLPAFDSYEWEDENVLHLMQTMFTETKLVQKFNIPMSTLREWLYEVYKHYNTVPFHNFRHSFCVTQMMYSISWHTNLSARLGDLEILILLVSCICHDLDHPGYNNIYQINARTELALRYNDISPLENHHCSIAFRLLENPDCNIFKNFSKDKFKEIREGIIRCILATDMARHNEILSQFEEISPNFDYSNQSHLCMILIKVADISNEARPMDIAEPWLERLLQEFFAQSAAEKSEGLPVTPFMDPDKVSKPGSQVRFIGLVLLPLFEALGQLLPEVVELIINPVKFALDYYKKLNDAQNKTRKSLIEEFASSEQGSPNLPRSQSGISVRSRKSLPSQKSTSRTSVDEQLCVSAELHDLPEGSESGDSEEATEVEVAEKTSKFKVNTEGNSSNKCSQPSSRKGSREKRPSMIGELGHRSRGSHGNIHNNYHRSYFGVSKAVSLDQYNSRRLSDGVPQGADENSISFNRQHRSLDNEAIYTNRMDNNSDKPTPDSMRPAEDLQNMNPCCVSPIQSTAPISSNVIQPNRLSNESKTFMSKLRQLTGRFSFSFEKDPKRVTPLSTNLISLKNNNADTIKGQYCVNLANRNSLTVSNKQSIPRNRALSLDVPVNRCSTSSGGSCDENNRLAENHSHKKLSPGKPDGDTGRGDDDDGNYI